MVVFTKVKKEELLKFIKDFSLEEVKTIYEEIRAKKGATTLILYNSGKLLLQGPSAEVHKIALQLERQELGVWEKEQKFEKESGWVIGSDEALKGDTFGGVVVAAVKADEKIRQKLIEYGVKDSKKLSDTEIPQLAGKIKKTAWCEIKSLLPAEYNKNGDITSLLNILHQSCASYLLPGKHIVDKYPGCTVGEIQEEHAEDKYVEVAAASILARAAALEQLNALSKEAGFRLPLGSTHVYLALTEMKEKNLDFSKFAKLNFKNVQEVVNSKP